MRSTGLPTTIEMLQNPDEFGGSKFHGMYRGFVKIAEDPEMLGRLKVYIPAVHPDDIKDTDLPWAEGCFQGGGGPDYGEFEVPYKRDDTVWVMFEHGDPNRPVWMGTWYGAPNKISEIPTEAKTGYPKVKVIKTRSGLKIIMNDNTSTITIQGGRINIGESATEALVLGNVLSTFLQEFLTSFIVPGIIAVGNFPGAPVVIDPVLMQRFIDFINKYVVNKKTNIISQSDFTKRNN